MAGLSTQLGRASRDVEGPNELGHLVGELGEDDEARRMYKEVVVGYRRSSDRIILHVGGQTEPGQLADWSGGV